MVVARHRRQGESKVALRLGDHWLHGIGRSRGVVVHPHPAGNLLRWTCEPESTGEQWVGIRTDSSGDEVHAFPSCQTRLQTVCIKGERQIVIAEAASVACRLAEPPAQRVRQEKPAAMRLRQ